MAFTPDQMFPKVHFHRTSSSVQRIHGTRISRANTPIWNRRHPEKVSFYVMASKVGNKPGQEIPLTDKSYHTWAYTCLMDGRILVQCAHPQQGWGYYLMTPNPGGESGFERIDCELAKTGILDRVSISPSETKVCFEYQKGFH
ncbi:MAG: hypothetical protein JW829_02105 [Pirellulales bacterium]|nr:hypothetical protein [Pirellulales bacterium]